MVYKHKDAHKVTASSPNAGFGSTGATPFRAKAVARSRPVNDIWPKLNFLKRAACLAPSG